MIRSCEIVCKSMYTYSTITNPRLGQAKICRFALKFRWIVAMKERRRPLISDSSIRIGIVWSSRNWWVEIIGDSPGKFVLRTVVFIGSVQAVFLTIAFPNFGYTNSIVTLKPIVRFTRWFYQRNLCANNEKNPKKRRISSSRIHGGDQNVRRHMRAEKNFNLLFLNRNLSEGTRILLSDERIEMREPAQCQSASQLLSTE